MKSPLAPWAPTKIIYEPGDEELTASAGLGPLIDVFVQIWQKSIEFELILHFAEKILSEQF